MMALTFNTILLECEKTTVWCPTPRMSVRDGWLYHCRRHWAKSHVFGSNNSTYVHKLSLISF